MKRVIPVLSIIFVVSVFFTVMAYSAEPEYVGVKKCKMCHKGASKGEQYEIWSQSKHAKAFETLQSEKALQIAKEKGLSKPPSESPECLKCHVTGHNDPNAKFAASFDKTQGVQCEACHGPGSLYKKKSIMKDRAKAIEMGMKDIKVDDGSAEKQCRQCHNEESPTYKEFNFQERWEQIKHYRPKE